MLIVALAFFTARSEDWWEGGLSGQNQPNAIGPLCGGCPVCRTSRDALIYSTHPAQAAGLLDVTPSFKFKMLGPHCMRVSLRPSVQTDGQDAAIRAYSAVTGTWNRSEHP